MKPRAAYETEARALLRDQLSRHSDEAVRTINAFCEPPADAVARVADVLERKDRPND